MSGAGLRQVDFRSRLHQVDRVVEEVVVHVAHIDVELAVELRPEGVPVAGQDVVRS
jgi:hypothetical protein